MARRRDDRLLIEIDTGPDLPGDEDDGTAAAEPERPSWFARRVTGPVGSRWRAVPRRTRAAVVAGTLAVAVLGTGAAVAVDQRADAAHAARLAAVRGGVVDLSAPLARTWEVETDAGVLARLDGGLLVTREGTEVLAVQAATGEVAWRHDLGALIECGSGDDWTPAWRLVPEASVTCLSGSPERTVTVIGADGEVLGARDLGAVSTFSTLELGTWSEVVMILADGAVAVADHVDLPLEATDPADAVAELRELRDAGAWDDPALRIEDALTGRVRGSGTLELTSGDLATCFEGIEAGSDLWFSAMPWPDAFGVQVSACGHDLRLGTDGATLDGGEDQSVPLAGGGSVTHTDGGSVVRAVDGGERTVPGYVVDVAAVDGPGGPLLAMIPDGTAAFAPDGTRLWRTTGDEAYVEQALVAASGTFVVTGGDGEVAGIDAATGAERWVRDDLLAPGYDSLTGITSLTDGDVGLLTLGSDGRTTRVVAFGIVDGATRWEMDLPGVHQEVVAVDGQVVVVDHGGGSTQRTVDGVPVRQAYAALRGYAVP